MNCIIKTLTDKDDKKAYELTKEIVSLSQSSCEYYCYLELFASMLTDKKSYIRTRGFILCCSQARWDNYGKIKQLLPLLMPLLHDVKPTVVRQCLNAIKEIIVYRPELNEIISNELDHINLLDYKESMRELILSDINKLRELIEEVRNKNELQ